MANISIVIGNVSASTAGQVRIDGVFIVSPNNGPYGFTCEHDWGDISININKAIRDAAVAEAELQGFNIRPQDKKTLYGAAQDANA
jgi:hypothetical protein